MARHLRLFTLGPPVLTSESGPLRFRTRKHFALLIRLGLECGRRFTREYLIDLLWADVPDVRGRHSLAQALSVLKAKVGRDRVLLAEATVALAEGTVDADVAHVREGDVDIRGPFLDGFDIPGAVSFEHWKDSWRSKLAPGVRDALVRQMEAKRRTGDFGGLERHARILLELDPLSEDGVRGVVEARVWAGDRTNALKVYSRFAQRLSDELGATPRPELRSLVDSVREGRPPVARMRVAETRVPGGANGSEDPPAEPLIGREREFGRLYDAWQDARRGRPRVVVLTGDAGIGKTTLANAVAAVCQLEGAVVARVQAYDAERELPFTVLAELTRQLAAQRVIGGAEPEALSELARIAPELRDAFPGVPRPPEWTAEVTPLRLADAFRRAVTAGGEDRPLVIVLDDVHATDNASAAILHVVARKLQDTRVLLILAGRSTELGVSDATTALTDDTVMKNLTRLELQALDADDSAQMVERLLAVGHEQHGVPPVARIVRASNGNPLAVELLAREWLAHGPESLLECLEAMDTLPSHQIGIPRAIGAMFERQVQRLDTHARSILDLAAVLGRRLADVSLYEAVQSTPVAAAEDLSQLRDQGILREFRGVLEFRNDLLRAQAYYRISAPARQHLHGRVADLLARRVGNCHWSANMEIAWHFLRSGQAGPALEHGLRGAREALKVGAPCEAEKLLSALANQSQPPTASLGLLLARSLLDQSKAAAAMPILEELCASSLLAARDSAEATCMRAAALYLMNRASSAEHYRVAENALVAARRAQDSNLAAKALLEYARSGAEAGDPHRVDRARRELDKLLESPTNQALATAWYARGYCQYLEHDLASAEASLVKAIRLLANSPDDVALILARNALGACQYYSCQFAAAHESLSEALDTARKVGDDFRYSATASNLCSLHILRGDFRDAVSMGRMSLDVGLPIPNQPNLMSSYTNLAEAHMLLGERNEAVRCIESAKEWMGIQRSWRANLNFLCESANLALMMGNLPLALQLTEEVESIARDRERAVPEAGMFWKLRILRTEYTSAGDKSSELAIKARDLFRIQHPVYFLETLAASAWVERRRHGTITDETKKDLELFETWGAIGLRASLAAQGFLPEPVQTGPRSVAN